MRVGISGYLLHAGSDYRAAGVSTYTYNLVQHLAEESRCHELLLFQGRDAPLLGGVRPICAPVPTYRPYVRIPWEQLALPLQLKRWGVDVVHGTVNVVPLLSPVPAVVTIHDLSFLRHPERFRASKAAYLRLAVRASVRKAARVIAVSNHTRLDLLELMDAAEERVRVVHSGVDPSFHPVSENELEDFRREVAGQRPYILHVGTLEPRKNLDVLIRAYATVRHRLGIPHALTLVGPQGWKYERIPQLVTELELESDVRFVDYVHPRALPLWYNCADLFAYPSAYEGFGLPLLEAMACGIPSITSASSALRELAGDACITVEPGSVESLQMAIAQVVGDEALRHKMRTAGLNRASEFSWTTAARETVGVYEEAAEETR